MSTMTERSLHIQRRARSHLLGEEPENLAHERDGESILARHRRDTSMEKRQLRPPARYSCLPREGSLLVFCTLFYFGEI